MAACIKFSLLTSRYLLRPIGSLQIILTLGYASASAHDNMTGQDVQHAGA